MKDKQDRRHIQVKRAWRKDGRPGSLKSWARDSHWSLAQIWLTEK